MVVAICSSWPKATMLDEPQPVVIDRSGNEVSGESPRDLGSPRSHRFSDGPALKSIRWDQFIYCDNEEKNVFHRTYKNARPFSEGYAAVSDVSQQGMTKDAVSTLSFGSAPWQYIDRNGKVAFDRKFARVSEFHADRAIVCTLERPWNPICINSKGETVFDNPKFKGINPFSDDGFAVVSTGWPPVTFGLINRDGKLVISGLRMRNFSEGLGAFLDRKTGRYGYVDPHGNVKIKPRFFRAEPFHEGYAVVSDEDMAPTVYEYSTCSRLVFSFIDKTGATLKLNLKKRSEVCAATDFDNGKATLFFREPKQKTKL